VERAADRVDDEAKQVGDGLYHYRPDPRTDEFPLALISLNPAQWLEPDEL